MIYNLSLPIPNSITIINNDKANTTKTLYVKHKQLFKITEAQNNKHKETNIVLKMVEFFCFFIFIAMCHCVSYCV